VYDADLKEYNLEYTDSEGHEHSRRIYYCLFCGGRAPEGKREDLFHKVSAEEHDRLQKLVLNCNSLGDLSKTIGKPNYMSSTTYGSPEQDDKPPVKTSYRVAVYDELSEVALLQIELNADNSIHNSSVVAKSKSHCRPPPEAKATENIEPEPEGDGLKPAP